jgi:hypothetical protein
VLTEILAAHINDATGKTKGLGRKDLENAIDNDDFRSSTWLRTKDFQRHGLRGHNWFGWFCGDGFAGVGSRDRNRRLAPATTQTE